MISIIPHDNRYFDSTGKRRYGHPALNGVLPQPWLPLKKGQSMRNVAQSVANGVDPDPAPAVVLTLRKRHSIIRPRSIEPVSAPSNIGRDSNEPTPGLDIVTANPWRDAGASSRIPPHRIHHRLSFDQPSGVIMLPEEDWLEEESDSDEEFVHARSADDDTVVSQQSSPPASTTPSKHYATYYHHPERRKRPS